MELIQHEIDELPRLWPGVQFIEENGRPHFLIPAFPLPADCLPRTTDLLLCPYSRDGYPCRVLFEDIVTPGAGLTWSEFRVLERTWRGFSWRLQGEGHRRLAQIVYGFTRALR